jgi:hypothetical protein
MNRTALKALLTLLFALMLAPQAEAQLIKKGNKKLNAKAQLAIERRRADSLSLLVEEMRQRESEWQRAWYDAKRERAQKTEQPTQPEPFAVDYSPAQLDSLAAELKRQQVNGWFENFFNDYVCEPELFSTDASKDSLYKSRLNALVTPIRLPYNELVRTNIQRYTDASGVMSRVLSRAQ